MRQELFGTNLLFANVDALKEFVVWARDKGASSICVGDISLDFYQAPAPFKSFDEKEATHD